MTPEQRTAQGLLDFMGHKKAIEHCEFVLSYVVKSRLRIFWVKVISLIKESAD